MRAPIRPTKASGRRHAGWTAIAPLPLVLATLLAVPIFLMVPRSDGRGSTGTAPPPQGFVDSIEALASAALDVVTDPGTLVRFVTGGRSGSVDVESRRPR